MRAPNERLLPRVARKWSPFENSQHIIPLTLYIDDTHDESKVESV